MSSEGKILLKAVGKALLIAVLSILAFFGLLLFIFYFPIGRFVDDLSGSFRRSCKKLNGQEFTLRSIQSIEGTVYGYGINGYSTQTLSQKNIDEYFYSQKRLRECKSQNYNSDECKELQYYIYNQNTIDINMGTLKQHWTCSLHINENSHTITTEVYYEDID